MLLKILSIIQHGLQFVLKIKTMDNVHVHKFPSSISVYFQNQHSTQYHQKLIHNDGPKFFCLWMICEHTVECSVECLSSDFFTVIDLGVWEGILINDVSVIMYLLFHWELVTQPIPESWLLVICDEG